MILQVQFFTWHTRSTRPFNHGISKILVHAASNVIQNYPFIFSIRNPLTLMFYLSLSNSHTISIGISISISIRMQIFIDINSNESGERGAQIE
jgi:hypothetical protein